MKKNSRKCESLSKMKYSVSLRNFLLLPTFEDYSTMWQYRRIKVDDLSWNLIIEQLLSNSFQLIAKKVKVEQDASSLFLKVCTSTFKAIGSSKI